MSNQTIYPYGTDGELPSSIGLVNDLVTGGADKALTAEQGKNLNTLVHTVFGDTITETVQDEFTAGFGEYESLNAINLANQPFILKKNHDTDISIKKIKLNANSTGSLRLAYVTKVVYNSISSTSTALSNVVFNQLGIITVSSTGENVIDVNYTLPEGAHLAIGNMNDSGGVTWMWASTTINASQGAVFFSSTGTHNSAITNHPICVGYEYEYTKTYGYGGGILRETLKSTIKGKKISILGDSISTFSGYIPSGNATFYPRTGNDVTIVSDTWWMKVINAFGASLELNNSWSGSKVTGTESSSAVTRATNLGNNPDIIIVWIGINDFNQEVGIGTWNGTTEMPTSRTTFREAYAIMLNTILTTYSSAKIYCCTLPDIERNSPNSNPPEINEAGVSLKTWNDAIKEVCDALCVEVIDLSKCGIHWHNLSINTSDNVHPNIKGHNIIANYIINKLDNAIWKRY